MQLYNNMMNSPRSLYPSCDISNFSDLASRSSIEKDEKINKIDFMAFEEKELRRIRNNDAARRSRQARRIKETKNRTRMAALEHENGVLRAQIDILKKELEHVHLIILATNVQILHSKDYYKINFR
ncbi:Thyrotroph embryonic factor [Dirofilaria immitis]